MVLILRPHCCRDLPGNKLTGTIPDSLAQLMSLKFLYVRPLSHPLNLTPLC